MARRESYEEIIFQINTLLKQGGFYPKYIEEISKGKNDFKIAQVYTKKNYDDSWIDTIEETIVALDTIVRNPRKFIVIEEDIVDISLARSISVESVKHLSQHTNLISSVTKDGMVIPSKILNTSKEESYEIYENRFIYTLLLKLRDFIDRRFGLIKSALLQSGELEVNITSEFAIDDHKVNFNFGGAANFPFDSAVNRKSGILTNVERITRINSIISDFLGSAFAKEMRSCALVRPPIQRTNVILKDPNFKKALVLWQFIETSEKLDFSVETVKETADMPEALAEKYRSLVYLNTILLQSIASTREGDESFESQKKDPIVADEYTSKNIDDFVPDDFPQLKMELSEIRRIYQKLPNEKTLPPATLAKLSAGIDRVIRQYEINKAAEESVRQKKLIAQQLKEEAEAKRLALKEAQEEERRKKREEARYRMEMRRLKAEQKRLEEERKKQEEEKAKELARLEAERKRLEEEQARELARIEAEKKAAEEREAELEALREAVKASELAKIEEEKRAREELAKAEEARLNAEQEKAKALHEAEVQKQLLFEEQERIRIAEEQRIAEELEKERIIAAERDAELAAAEEALKLQHKQELMRLLDEEMRRKENEEKRKEVDRLAFEYRLAEEKAKRVNTLERAEHLRKLAEEHKRSEETLKILHEKAVKEMYDLREEYYRTERALATQRLININRIALNREEEREIDRITSYQNTKRAQLKELEELIATIFTADHIEAIEKLKKLALKHRDEVEIDEVLGKYDATKTLKEKLKRRYRKKKRDRLKKKENKHDKN